MWVFLNNAFLSIVDPGAADRTPTDKLMVRARFKGDIERVFPGAGVVSLRGRDYPYRAMVSRRAVAQKISDEVEAIKYPNFKDSIAHDDSRRHHAYLDVWSAMARRGDTVQGAFADDLREVYGFGRGYSPTTEIYDRYAENARLRENAKAKAKAKPKRQKRLTKGR